MFIIHYYLLLYIILYIFCIIVLYIYIIYRTPGTSDLGVPTSPRSRRHLSPCAFFPITRAGAEAAEAAEARGNVASTCFFYRKTIGKP